MEKIKDFIKKNNWFISLIAGAAGMYMILSYAGVLRTGKYCILEGDLIEIYVPVIRVYIKEKLGSIEDLVNRLYGMLSPYDREERYRIENEKERTRNTEKVSHHKICSPCCLKFGQTVKDIECILSLFFYHVMDISREVFKSV